MTLQRLDDLPASLRTNVLSAAIATGLVLGALLGWLLPVRVWLCGSPTALGDFALFLLVALLAWRALYNGRGRGAWLFPGIAALAGVLVRELLWRLPDLRPLGIVYGMATFTGLGATLGWVGYLLARQWRQRPKPHWQLGEPPLDPESLIAFTLGVLLLGWWLVGLIAAVLFPIPTPPPPFPPTGP